MSEMQGTRMPDNTNSFNVPEGAYWRRLDPPRPDGVNPWWCRTPTGDIGRLGRHDVTEHEDGTITVEPSILVTTTRDGQPVELFHGWLRRGVWSW